MKVEDERANVGRMDLSHWRAVLDEQSTEREMIRPRQGDETTIFGALLEKRQRRWTNGERMVSRQTLPGDGIPAAPKPANAKLYGHKFRFHPLFQRSSLSNLCISSFSRKAPVKDKAVQRLQMITSSYVNYVLEYLRVHKYQQSSACAIYHDLGASH